MKLTLGFSPCPNDTFIFDALVNNKIDTGDLSLEVLLEDVETLNQLALKNTLDISKISYGVLPLVFENYIVLNSGSALGTGVGPLLISGPHQNSPAIWRGSGGPHQTSPHRGGLRSSSEIEEYINCCTVAIPGEHTTAHMLFSLAFPDGMNKIFLRYDEIEDFVLSAKENVAGVIIHENRFTYQEKGLVKILDLGEYWEQKTQSPIPLGGIVAKRNINHSLLKTIDSLIKKSIEYSFSNYPTITGYVREHSQEMEEDVMRKHIDLYVNDYSINLGDKGKNAIMELIGVYEKTDAVTGKYKQIFLG